MEEELYKTLVDAMCDRITSEAALEEILVSKIFDIDETISEDAATRIAQRLISEKYIDADNVVSRLDEEARENYYDKLFDYRSLVGSAV